MGNGRVPWLAALITGAALALVGCSATAVGNELVIDLKTDLLPGVEFFSVRTVITETVQAGDEPAIDVRRTINADQDFFQGVRLGEFQQLTASEVTVEVALLDADEKVIMARPTRVTLNGVRAVTVVISRDCRGVECPLANGDPNFAACLGGSCVDPRCHPEAIEYCDPKAFDCTTDTECSVEVECTTPRCVERVCFAEVDDGLCDALQMCIPESGCVDVPPTCTDGVMNGNETSIDCGGECECIQSWVKGFGDLTEESGVAVGVDSAGNLYVTGTFESSINLGGTTRVHADTGSGGFLASFDAHGTHRWSKTIVPSDNKRVHSLTIDANDNIIIAFTARVLDDGWQGYVAKYDSTGSQRWARSIAGTDGGSNGDVDSLYVSTDAKGVVYVVGEFRGMVEVEGQEVVSNGSIDILVAALHQDNGSLRWINSYGSSAMDRGLGIAAATNGTHFITGTFNGLFSFGGPSLTPSGNDVFVAAFNQSGFLQWSWSAGSAGTDSGHVVALRSNDQLFVAGNFEQQVDFGAGPHISNGATDGFLLSVDATTGQVQWSKQFGGTNADTVRGIDVSASGKVLLCGDYYLNFNADGTPFTGEGDWDAFVMSFDASSGAFEAWQSYGGAGLDRANGLAVASAEAMYLTGSFSGSIEMIGEPLSSAGGGDMFLLSTPEP